MKRIFIFLGVALASAWFSCVAAPIPPITFAPAGGGSPTGPEIATPSGQLQVYSALRGRREGDNPTWKQHSDYYVYNENGRRLEHVKNTVSYYQQRPRAISLPAGSYVVKAQSQDYGWVKVPVAIEGGRTTTVYLDDSWQPTSYARNVQVIRAANGQTIGWSVN